MYDKPVSDCFFTVDATDFRLLEVAPFDPKCWCHKTNYSGLWYELAVTVEAGKIVWEMVCFLTISCKFFVALLKENYVLRILSSAIKNMETKNASYRPKDFSYISKS